MPEIKIKKYISLSFFNLLIVAVYGVVMRYKIGFEFPYFDQKSLQEAHSHFAFAGWISQTLFVLMTAALSRKSTTFSVTKYFRLLNANLLCSYGMLVSFTIQGYGPVSIFFSTLSLILSFVFAYFFITDSKNITGGFKGGNWFRMALWLNVFSSLGTLSLAYMMATKNIHQDIYLSSVYFYLHFQYNGWFFFACMGLFFHKINVVVPDFKENKIIFYLFAFSCIPAYFLSTLWLRLPMIVYLLTAFAALTQVFAWGSLINQLRKHVSAIRDNTTLFTRYLFIYIGLAVSVKLTLQLFSIIPFISKLAFGFRTIVIAYLHLVLLAIISTFLISYIHTFGFVDSAKLIRNSIYLFTTGILLNEFVLLIQGVASFSYTLIPFGNEMLFAISLILVTSTLLFFLGSLKRS